MWRRTRSRSTPSKKADSAGSASMRSYSSSTTRVRAPRPPIGVQQRHGWAPFARPARPVAPRRVSMVARAACSDLARSLHPPAAPTRGRVENSARGGGARFRRHQPLLRPRDIPCTPSSSEPSARPPALAIAAGGPAAGRGGRRVGGRHRLPEQLHHRPDRRRHPRGRGVRLRHLRPVAGQGRRHRHRRQQALRRQAGRQLGLELQPAGRRRQPAFTQGHAYRYSIFATDTAGSTWQRSGGFATLIRYASVTYNRFHVIKDGDNIGCRRLRGPQPLR